MLEISDLHANYGGIRALKGVDILVKPGTMVSIIGANGAGKTTLLKAVVGIIRTKEGRISFQQQDISKSQPENIVEMGVSLVPEGRQVFGRLSVEDNLSLGAFLFHNRRGHKQIPATKREVFSIFPVLEHRRGQLAGTLSGGEQQMLAIGRALMARPKLLLLDEPSTGLAPLVVKEIFEVIADLNQKGTTIVLVEQNARAALRITSYGYVLETGKVATHGPTKELLANEQIKKAYLGG